MAQRRPRVKGGHPMASRLRHPSGTFVLMVGTKRGLALLTSRDRRTWQGGGPYLAGRRVFNAALDQRDGWRLYAAENGDFFGNFLRYSHDLGETWEAPSRGIR